MFKKCKRISLCILCLLLGGIAILYGCDRTPPKQGDGNETGTKHETETEAGVGLNPDGTVSLIRNGEVCITVAYGSGIDHDAERAMEMLIAKMETDFGATLSEPQPWGGEPDGQSRIIFGRVETEGCEDLWERIRMRDYAISVADGNIYIAAGSTSGYGMAVNLLIADLKELTGGKNPVLDLSLSAEYSVFEEGTYLMKYMQVNGVSLGDFVLLKPSDPLITDPVFERLTEMLSVGYGHSFTTAQTRPENTPVLRMEIDPDMEKLHYGYRVEDGDLVICAGGPFSMYCAAEQIVSLLRTGSSDRVSEIALKDGDSEQVSLLDCPDGLDRADNSSFRLMSCNIMADNSEPGFIGWDNTGNVTFEMRTEIFELFVSVFEPDIIGIQEFSPSWYKWWQTTYADTPWRLSSAGLEGRPESTGMLNPIMYRSDLFTVVEEGWQDFSRSHSLRGARYMSWIVLECIETGERFGVVNVHWDGWSKPEPNAVQREETLAKIKELAEKYQCPMLSTGDFNTDEEDPDYAALLADGYLKDAKFNCDVQVNNVGSCHGWSKPPAEAWSFDHIFATQDTEIRQFCTAWYNQQIYASDHAWLLADIDISRNAIAQ